MYHKYNILDRIMVQSNLNKIRFTTIIIYFTKNELKDTVLSNKAKNCVCKYFEYGKMSNNNYDI